MARMLRFADSVEKHLDAAGRHQRLCYQVNGARKFALAIEPQCAVLQQKYELYQGAVKSRIHAYDALVLHDHMMDDGVRTAFEKCKQYERENPGDPVLHIIFPHERFSAIIRKGLFKEHNVVEQVAVKFDSLGENHELYPVAAYLRKYITGMRKAINTFEEAQRKEKMAQAQVEMAKNGLRTQYEANYLDARKETGRIHADYLFPKLTHKPVVQVPEEPDEEVSEAA